MLPRIGRGWAMAKSSWAVLKVHPKLLLFSILFRARVHCSPRSDRGHRGAKSDTVGHFAGNVRHDETLTYRALFALYFACMCIIDLFNAVGVFCALQSFTGMEPSQRAGIVRAAGSRHRSWLGRHSRGYAERAAELKDRLGYLGLLLLEAVKRSSSILHGTWSEATGGEGCLSAIGVLLALALVLLIGFMAAAGRALGADAAVVVALAAIVVPYVLVLMVLIFRTGVYIYATTGKAPASMNLALLQAAFRRKPALH